MPLYDYQCRQCESGFTELRRSSAMDSPISCPECGSRETRRSVSSFSVGASASGMPSVCAPSRSQFS